MQEILIILLQVCCIKMKWKSVQIYLFVCTCSIGQIHCNYYNKTGLQPVSRPYRSLQFVRADKSTKTGHFGQQICIAIWISATFCPGVQATIQIPGRQVFRQSLHSNTGHGRYLKANCTLITTKSNKKWGKRVFPIIRDFVLICSLSYDN